MTHDELYDAALDCARSARRTADRAPDMSTAYSRAGELFLKLAAYRMGLDGLAGLQPSHDEFPYAQDRDAPTS